MDLEILKEELDWFSQKCEKHPTLVCTLLFGDRKVSTIEMTREYSHMSLNLYMIGNL
jgi:hypothetical protein